MTFLEVFIIEKNKKNYEKKLININKLKSEISNFNSRELYIIDGKYQQCKYGH